MDAGRWMEGRLGRNLYYFISTEATYISVICCFGDCIYKSVCLIWLSCGLLFYELMGVCDIDRKCTGSVCMSTSSI
jgi:hypothetical protein